MFVSMMFYFTVIVCAVTLLSGTIRSSTYENLDESEIQKLFQNFEDTRNVNIRQNELGELKDLETELLVQRTLTELENELQKTAEGDDQENIENVQSRWWCSWCRSKITATTTKKKRFQYKRTIRKVFRRS